LSTNINDSFFKGIYKDAWRKTIPIGLTEAEVDFIEDISELKGKGNVLDIMCGYGRHSIELAKRGIAVTAVDNLGAYIDEIKTSAKEKKIEIQTIQSNALAVDLGNKVFDAIICMGNSFNFFNKEDASTILKNLSEHIKPHGCLIINSWMIAEIAIKHFQEKSWHLAGDYKCILDYTFLFHPSRILSEQTIIGPDNTVEILKGIDYIFTLDELESIFQKAGFRTKDLYSTPRKRKFRMGDTQIYVVAEKI
jgi:cyclopropane fatty-acyl-phospholipid synthase-like methyltransferase